MNPITQLRTWHYNRINEKPRVLKDWGRFDMMWEYGLGDKFFAMRPTDTSHSELFARNALYYVDFIVVFPLIGEHRLQFDKKCAIRDGVWNSYYSKIGKKNATWRSDRITYWHTPWKSLKEERAWSHS